MTQLFLQVELLLMMSKMMMVILVENPFEYSY